MKLHIGYYYEGLGAVGALVLRLALGIAFMAHGFEKIKNPFGWMNAFPGAHPPGFLQALAAVAEFGGGVALILGLLFPLAMFGIMCTMFVARMAHAGQPFVSTGHAETWEDVGIYFATALMFLLLGPGRLALDALLFGRKRALFGDANLSATPSPSYAEPR